MGFIPFLLGKLLLVIVDCTVYDFIFVPFLPAIRAGAG